MPEATFLYNQARALDKLESYEQALKALNQAQAQHERPLPEELMQKAKPFEAELKEKIAAQNKPKPVVPQVPVKTIQSAESSSLGFKGYTGIGLIGVGAGVLVWSALLASDVTKEQDG